MNLLDHITGNGRQYKRVSSNNGGEYHGPCPVCGGNDRFHIWPDQGEHGTVWCRSCGLAGDAIEYLMKVDGMTFPAAANLVGKTITDQEEYQAPQFKRPAADTFTPRETTAPADLWIQHAEKLVNWAHDQLLATPDQLAWLAARGINLKSVIKHKLGWNPGEKGKDMYRVREAWGLETVLGKHGKPKRLWLPIGLVIPRFSDGTVRAIQIRIPNDRRTPDFDLPYWPVPGSVLDTFITNPTAKAFVIIESVLDGILIDEHVGDLVGTMAMGSSVTKPTAAAFELLEKALHISNALDYDAETAADGTYKNPGGVGWLWWKKHFPQAERWPVPVGKDPGDAYKAGTDIREWIKAGLPPILNLPPARKPPARLPPQDNSGADSSASSPEQEPALIVRTCAARDGRMFHITNNSAEYSRLVSAGEIVFDFQEIELVKQSGATPEEAANFLDFKQTFPGIRISNVRPDTGESKPERMQYRGKYEAITQRDNPQHHR